jgi:hypothetical protein
MVVGPRAWDLFFCKLSAAQRAIAEKNDARLCGRAKNVAAEAAPTSNEETK